MRYRSLLFVIVLIASISSSPVSAQYNFNYSFIGAQTGKVISYANYQGKPLLIDAFATYCEPCKVEVLHIKEVYHQLGDKVNVLTISTDPSTDSLTKIMKFRNQFEATWTFGLDSNYTLHDKFNVTTLPSLLLFNQNGTLVKMWEDVTSVSTIYAELHNQFGMVVPVSQQRSDLTITLERLLASTPFQVTFVVTTLLVIYIIISNLVNKKEEIE